MPPEAIKSEMKNIQRRCHSDLIGAQVEQLSGQLGPLFRATKKLFHENQPNIGRITF